MFHFVTNAEGLTHGQLKGGFFEGWPHPPSAEKHLQILQRSSHIVCALAPSDGVSAQALSQMEVVGFVNAISDNVLSAYIPLLEVLPAHRKKGLGRELMERMFAQLTHLYMIDVSCDPEIRPFYESLGMRAGVSMIRRHYDILKNA